MIDTIKILVPDVGDFDNIPVIEVLVSAGDQVVAEQSLITLESDKATMEIPAPKAGKILSLDVALGDEVNLGDVIATLEVTEATAVQETLELGSMESATETVETVETVETDEILAEIVEETVEEVIDPAADYDYDLVVLGAGPGGYTAAFRAADLGLKVALIERYATLGGVCLNVGCIPSKALLHTARVIDEAESMAAHGLHFGEPEIDIEQLRTWKVSVVSQLTGGLANIAQQRKITVITGHGRFTDGHNLMVAGEGGLKAVSFAHCIIAAGSQSVKLPGLPWGDPRLMDSTDALELEEIPQRLLVIGGGIIGLEMATVYQALGSQVTVVEMLDQLIPGADKDLIRPLQRRLKGRLNNIFLNTRVEKVEVGEDALSVHLSGKNVPAKLDFDRVLVAVGRTPNGKLIGADKAGVTVDERGFIPVNKQMQTNQPHIFAIGDIVGQPMLAHKATHEAKVAAEVCAGEKSFFDARVIPSVAYTDPEIAWVGVTEIEAKDKGIDYKVGKFPWAASGRALGIARSEGFTKLLFNPQTNQVIGAGIVGVNAGELISECALAIEMGAEAADIGLTIHPHPTLSETVAMAAEAFEGTITDLYMPKRK
ncbi:MAG: dihydrolipoyl dehydrogenase [Proteobacteria bacterium]|nr:dihydrolipoyl dehydrogenase [Pseudomonadota bacterium]